jgi:glycosyltransferase involved in cell wall biosynthesis
MDRKRENGASAIFFRTQENFEGNMRILHLEASGGWGGQEMRILRESLGMKERGHEVFFVVMRGAELGSRAKKAGFTVYEANFHKGGWLKTFWDLYQVIGRHRIEIVNTHSSLDAWIGGIAGKAKGIPVVRTRHLSSPIRKGWNSRVLYGKLADFVVTTCASMVDVISKQSGKPLEKLRSIATGVDRGAIQVTSSEAAAFREKFGIREEEFLVGTACFMRSWKGIDDFLHAADLLRGVENLRWVVIGGGHEETYRTLSRELKLDQHVVFTGHLENPFPALAALDVFTLLSTAHEGVSQAILQAAYLAKPLIATATGGLGEVCLDRITGIQVAPFSPSQVARAVLEMKENRFLRECCAQRAKALVEERFTWEGTLDQMESSYAQVVGKSGSR